MSHKSPLFQLVRLSVDLDKGIAVEDDAKLNLAVDMRCAVVLGTEVNLKFWPSQEMTS